MAFWISNRKLVRVLVVLTSTVCVWMMYFIYHTQFIHSRRSDFLMQEMELKFSGSNTPFSTTGSKYSSENSITSSNPLDKSTFSKSFVSNSTKMDSDKHLDKNPLDISVHYPNKINQSIMVDQRLGKHSTSTAHVTTKLASSSIQKTNVPTVAVSLLPPSGSVHTDNGYIVYLCDSLVLCGGWGDRQRGLTSLFFASRVVGRQFKIVMTTPCDLTNFYLPNKVDWRMDAKEVRNLSSQVVNAISNDRLLTEIMSTDFNKKFTHKVVYIRTFSDLYHRMKKNSLYTQIIKQWKGIADKRERFRWAWQELMRPSRLLLKHLEHIVGSNFLIRKGLIQEPVNKNPKIKSIYDVSNSTLVCGHVRIGKNPTIPMDEDLSYFKITDLPTLHEFMLAKGHAADDPYYFVAADYDYVREKSRAFFGDRLIDYGGKIIHIDRQRDGQRACMGLEVALIDQLLLSLCDVLVICNSGFSRHASFLNNSTDNIYMLENGLINKQTFIQTPTFKAKT